MRKLAAVMVSLVLLTGCAAKSGTTPAPAPAPSDPAPPPSTPLPADLPPPKQSSGVTDDYTAALEAMRMGNYAAAADRFQRVLQSEPSDAKAWNWLSFALVRTERPSVVPGVHLRGIEAASKAVLMKPDLPEAQYNLGLALLANGQYADALAPLKVAVDEQRSQDRLTAFGLALIGAGRADEAIPVCREADRPTNEFWLGRACLELTGEGFKRINPADAAIGDWLYEPPKGFVWKGRPGAAGTGEERGISPPWTCAYEYPSGFRELQLGCRGDGLSYAWEVATEKVGMNPAMIGVGTPLKKVAEVYGTSTYRSNRGLHYLVADIHMVIYLNGNDTVQRIFFERPIPVFAIDRLLRGDTGPAPLSDADAALEGVRLGLAEAGVDRLLGPSISGTARVQGTYERVYKEGDLRVHYRDHDRTVQRVDVIAGTYKTARGIAVGAPAADVRRLYGRPQVNADQSEYVYPAGSYVVAFQIRSNKVASISLVKVGP